jgi:hypothetical protein
MKKNDKTPDKTTADRIKNLGLDEPSADFTNKVMQLIVSEQPLYTEKPRNYWWLLLLIPVLSGIIGYSLVFFRLTGYISHFWDSLQSTINPFINTIISSADQFKHINLPAYMLLGFTAILALLTIEELISRTKHIH